MTNNYLENYLIQTQQLFGNKLVLSDTNTDFFIVEEGNPSSNILFIKESLVDKELYEKETKLFSNILKALNLSYNDIFMMTVSYNKKNIRFSSSFDKIQPSIIIVFGSSISKMFLNNNYKGINIISTYSLIEMINDQKLKKYVWNDLKPILTM
tara:strand:+ start:713 stop:1171 length:459 start_codon:yes stop_codon:yes gene_type:complete